MITGAYLGVKALFECTWEVIRSPIERRDPDNGEQPFEAFDILFSPSQQPKTNEVTQLPSLKSTEWSTGYQIVITSSDGEMTEATAESLGSEKAFEFLHQLMSRVMTQERAQLAKIIVPRCSGYIVRADIVEMRMVDSEFVDSVTSFAEPQQHFANHGVEGVEGVECVSSLDLLFRKAAAGIVMRLDGYMDEDKILITESDFQPLSRSLNGELDNRLCFPWLVRDIHPRKTLAIIEAGRVNPRYGGTGPSVYGAAKTLGLNIIAMDNHGHWMEGPEFADWRQAFVPLALHDPPREDFTDRIIETVRSCGIQIDGIMTLCESYMNPVAKACERLGFPTQSPHPYTTATDKYKTSIFEGHMAYQAQSVDEAVSIASKVTNLSYPLIIKPCNGWSSEGVSLVHKASEITTAIEAIDTTRHGTAFVMEPYCSGPEVDVNLFLLDGEILFFEVCDDMPKSADDNGSGSLNTFIELNSVFPSALPRDEIAILRDSFHASLLRMGFDTGLFHLEGRVQNSRVAYRTVEGTTDLYPVENGQARDITAELAPPTAWLIEINPRPPGMKGSQIIESTWGIDYWSLTLLTALRDDDRLRVLSHPFSTGPQYTCIMVFIPTDYDVDQCEGIYDSDDIVAELFERRPDLARNVSKAGCLVYRGQKIPHPRHGHNSFLAYFNVYSRSGRVHALRLADVIRKEVRFSFR